MGEFADDRGLFWVAPTKPIKVGRTAASPRAAASPRGLPSFPETDWQLPTEFPSLLDASVIALDIETYDPELTSKGPGVRRDGYMVGVAIGTDTGFRKYFPVRHKEGPNCDQETVLGWLRDLLGRGLPTVGANLLYDLDYLDSLGVHARGPLWDVQVAEPLINENRVSYSLESLANHYLGEGKVTHLLFDWARRAFGAEKRAYENIWRMPANLVGPYAEGDVDLPLRIFEQQRPILEAEGLTGVFDLESKLIPILLDMRRRGVRVDTEHAEQLRDRCQVRYDDAVRTLGGEEVVWGAEELAKKFDKEGVEYPRTRAGKPSFTKEWLAACEHPLARTVSEARKLQKLQSTFIEGYILNSHIKGRIHAQFNQLRSDDSGAVSGRFCVAPDTVLDTSRGSFKIAEYEPSDGDLVQTHTGAWQQVIGKCFKGHEEMFRVETETGAFVECTAGHRLWTGHKWVHVRDLAVGDEVMCYEDARLHKGPRISEACFGYVSVGGTPHDTGVRGDLQHYVERGPGDRVEGPGAGSLPVREVASVLEEQDGTEEPDAWEDALVASQLEGRGGGREGLLDGSDIGQSQGIRASGGGEAGLGSREVGSVLGRAPHRRRPKEQRLGQPSANDERGASEAAQRFGRSKIVAIHPVGSKEVWDIEVRGDHSYCAQGLVHHNSSSNPNLQNIPRRDQEFGKEVRSLFVADEGEDYGKYDWSQLEYRIMVHYASEMNLPGGPEAAALFRDDPKTDFHTMVAELCGIKRGDAKSINFGLAYGMGHSKLKAALGCADSEAERIISQYHTKAPFIKALFNKCSEVATTRGYIRTFSGRRRRFNVWGGRDGKFYDTRERLENEPENSVPRTRAFTHKALNALAQGGNADLAKEAMVMFSESGVLDVLGPILLTVHDEFGFSVPRTAAGAEAFAEVKNIMQTVRQLHVPLIAEGGLGPNWGAIE